MVSIRFHAAAVLFIAALFVAAVPVHAASCSRSDDRSIERKYDNAVADFDDEVDDLDITDTVRDIRDEIRRGGSSSAVDAALRGLDSDIDDADREGDRRYDSFRDLRDRSQYEDCRAEVSDRADDLRRYIDDIIQDFRRDLRKLRDDAGGSSNAHRRGEVRAPTWHWGEETKQTASTTPEKKHVAFGQSRDSDHSQEQKQPRKRTAVDIRAEIDRMLTKLQALLVEYTGALVTA